MSYDPVIGQIKFDQSIDLTRFDMFKPIEKK